MKTIRQLILIFSILLIGIQGFSQTPLYSFGLNETSTVEGIQLTSGVLVVDSVYKIGKFEAGDDFSNVGGTNESGDVFTATGTTPTTWTNSSILRLQNYGTLEDQKGVVGIQDDVYLVLDHRGSGRRGYSLDGVDDEIPLPPAAFSFNGSLAIDFETTSDVTIQQYIIGGAVPRMYLRILSGVVQIVLGDDVTQIAIASVSANTKYSVYYEWTDGNNDGDGTVDIWVKVGGVITKTLTAGAYTGFTSFPADFGLGANASGSFFGGNISRITIFDAVTGESTYYLTASNPIKAADTVVLHLNAEGVRPNQWADLLNGDEYTVDGATMQIPSISNLGASWFNGATSVSTFTGMETIDTDITISAEIFMIGWGESNFGRILTSGDLYFLVGSGSEHLRITRDNATSAVSANNSLVLNTKYHVLITSTADGASTNLYINGVLSGTANQDAGTSNSATTYYIGNNSAAATATWEGWIRDIVIDKYIWSQDKITEEASKYKN